MNLPEFSRNTKLNNPYLWILFIALLLRILWAIVAVPITPLSDCLAYDTFARNLAQGYSYGWTPTEPTANWAPGTSFVYSLFYRVFGYTYVPIIIFNLLLGIIIIGISMQLAARWFNQQIALLTGLLLTLWPNIIQFTTILSSELLFTALLLIVMKMWLNEQTQLWLKALLVGIMLTAACYVRVDAIFIPLVLFLFRWINTREILRTLGAVAIILIVMSLLIAPWSIRNTKLYGEFTLISGVLGTAFWSGNNPNTVGGKPVYAKPKETEGMDIAQRADYLGSIAINYIKEHPFKFIIRTFEKLIFLHSSQTIGVVWNQEGLVFRYGTSVLFPLKVINQLYWLSVLGLALIGIILLGKQQGWLKMIIHPVVVIWAYFAFGFAVTESTTRHNFYASPMVAILAAITIAYVWEVKRTGKIVIESL
jgi:4-amino-4-deoxy-L-arabinose transferase-like glycosyltransferase